MTAISRREALLLALSGSALAWAGSSARAEGTAQRVVTLGGDITEIVYALGAGGQVVGRDMTSSYPAEVRKLPDAGYYRQLSAEGVLSLRPGLILASASAGPPAVIQQIRGAGVHVELISDEKSTKGLLEKTKVIAAALKMPEKGEALAGDLQERIAKAQADVSKMSGKPRVLFIINAGAGAPMAAGRETGADALIALAGGENAFSEHTGYKPISLEAAAAASPDAIAMMTSTLDSMGGVAAVAQHPALRLTAAAKAKRIFARDGTYLLGFGPRLPEAIVDFAQAIRSGDAL